MTCELGPIMISILQKWNMDGIPHFTDEENKCQSRQIN